MKPKPRIQPRTPGTSHRTAWFAGISVALAVAACALLLVIAAPWDKPVYPDNAGDAGLTAISTLPTPNR